LQVQALLLDQVDSRDLILGKSSPR
jgi:hypothetical protein